MRRKPQTNTEAATTQQTQNVGLLLAVLPATDVDAWAKNARITLLPSPETLPEIVKMQNRRRKTEEFQSPQEPHPRCLLDRQN